MKPFSYLEDRRALNTLKSFLPRDLQAACREGAVKLLPGLLKALEDSREYVRQAAAEALRSMGKGAKEAVPKLQALSLNFAEDAQVQEQAVKALRSIGKEATKAVLPKLVKALHDSHQEVRKRATIALGLFGKEAQEAVPELMQTSLFDSDTAYAVGSIGRESKPAVLPELLKALDDSDASVRKRAVNVLRFMGEEAKEAVPELMKALYDSEAFVRCSCSWSIRVHGQRGNRSRAEAGEVFGRL